MTTDTAKEAIDVIDVHIEPYLARSMKLVPWMLNLPSMYSRVLPALSYRLDQSAVLAFCACGFTTDISRGPRNEGVPELATG